MIDENKLIEEIKSIQVTVNGLRPGRVLREYEKQYKESILRIIEEQPKEDVPFAYVNKWIPVSERLPKQDEGSEYYTSVIVTLDNGRVAEGCYRDKEKEWWADAPDGEHYSENVTGHVIAWMPLPEPYKPKGDE